MNPSEEPTPTPSNPASAVHEPQQAPPVMDVTPPPAGTEPANGPPAPAPDATGAPASPPKTTDAVAQEVKNQQAAKPAAPVVKKPASNGVTLAIIATVIIVLGLAALAVFAYKSSR